MQLAKVNIVGMPTPIAQSVARVLQCSPHDKSERFNCLQYLTEVYFKYHTLVAHSLISDLAPQTWQFVGYNLARASSLGTWDAELSRIERAVLQNSTSSEVRKLADWQRERRRGKGAKEDRWYNDADEMAQRMWAITGFERFTHAKSVRGLLSFLVAFRNKTRGHGAYPRSFYDRVNAPYEGLLANLLGNSEALAFSLLAGVSSNGDGVVATRLRGLLPTGTVDLAPGSAAADGLQLTTKELDAIVGFSQLLSFDPDSNEFFFANGGWVNSDSTYEGLNYYNGKVRVSPGSPFHLPPLSMPLSHTAGRALLTQGSNSAHNLPDPPASYIDRPILHEQLRDLLLDRTHRIITLHGMGGAGKTTLAREVAIELAAGIPSFGNFDLIIWFSSRDIDLLLEGPRQRLPDVKNLHDIASYFCKVLGEDIKGEEAYGTFSEYVSARDYPILLVMDNFETLDNPKEVHEALDRIVVLPSKVLITSRIRAFKGDFPVEVRGMEFDEASELLLRESRRVGCEGLMTPDAVLRIFEYTSGIPYAMKLVTGQLKRGRHLQQIVDQTITQEKIVDALFGREFDALIPEAKLLFLTLGRVGKDVPLIAVQAVFTMEKIPFYSALDDCERASLVEVHDSVGITILGMPEVAKKFARVQLISSEDRISVERHVKLLRSVYNFSKTADPVVAFARKIVSEIRRERSPEGKIELGHVLQALAEENAGAWEIIAQSRIEDGASPDQVREAFQRSVEASPNERKLWERWAEFEGLVSLEAGRYKSREVELRVRAAECDPADVAFSSRVAGEVVALFAQNRFPLTKRYEWVSGLIYNLEQQFNNLEPDALSRLGWLHLFIEQFGDAVRCVRRAFELDPRHRYTKDLERRLSTL